MPPQAVACSSPRTLGVMKLPLLFVASVFALAAGAGAGYQFGQESESARTKSLAVQANEQFLKTQALALVSTDQTTVEGALWRQIAALEADARSPAPMFDETTRARAATLAYARLSGLASEQVASEREAQLLNRAVALCPKTGWTDCSPASILSAAKKSSGQSGQ